jgi:NADH:ubiquinone oxidoreductase subunit 2 (subunit N)
MIDGSIFLGTIDAMNVPTIYRNILYSSVVNAGFKLATGAEGIRL